MNSYRLRVTYKLFIFTLLFFIMCSLQTSFWPNLIGIIPSPQFWLIMIFFIAVYWTSYANIFFVYFFGFCLTSFSDISLRILWSNLLVCFTLLWILKNRVQISGAFAFALYSFLGSFSFEVGHYVISRLVESNSHSALLFFDRSIQILVNFLFSYPLYFFFSKIDHFLLDEDEWQRSRSVGTETHHE